MATHLETPPERGTDRPRRSPGPALRILGLLVVGGLVLAHLEVASRGPGYAGPLRPLDHLYSLGLAAALLAVAVAAGGTLLRALELEPDHPVEAPLFGAVVGSGLLALVYLVLGGAGLLSPAWLAGATLAVALAARSELAALPGRIRAAGAAVGAGAGRGPVAAFAAVVAVGAAAFVLVHGTVPPGDWDSLMYHLEIPRAWLAEGRIHVPDGNLHAAYIGLFHLLYLPLLAAGSPAAPALLNGLFAVLLGAAVFAAGRRFGHADTGTLATGLLWASTGLLIVASTARIDTTLALALLLGHLALFDAVRAPDRAREKLFLAAIVLGVASAMKYHGLAYTAALAPVGLWALLRGSDDLPGRGRLLGATAAIFAVVLVPWLLKNQLLVGAPFYPFFSERLLPPWLAGLYGTASVPASLDPESLRLLGQAREPFDLVDFFLAPERLTVEAEGVHYHVNLFFLLLPVGLLHWRKPAVLAFAVPPVLYATAMLVRFPATNLRYLFPVLAPLTLLTAFLALDLAGRIPVAKLRRYGIVAVAAAALVPTLRSGVEWTRKAPVLGQAAGTVSPEDYLAAGFPFYAGIVGAVNREVPPEGRVLLLWEARGFHLARPHLPDNVLTNWPLLVPYLDRTGRCLEGAGISHVLASTGAVQYYLSRGTDPERVRWERFVRFADRCLDPVVSTNGFTLFRTRG